MAGDDRRDVWTVRNKPEWVSGMNTAGALIDYESVVPLDEQSLVRTIQKTHRAVVAYEGWPYGGVGAEVVDRIQRLAFDELDAPILRVTFRDVPMPYNAKLEQYVLPQPERIAAAVKEVLYRK